MSMGQMTLTLLTVRFILVIENEFHFQYQYRFKSSSKIFMEQVNQSVKESTLDALPVGSHAKIKTIDFSPLMGRLVDLGFAPGAEVTVLRTVPMGNLRVYRVDGCDVSLRVSTAQTVKVTIRDGNGPVQ